MLLEVGIKVTLAGGMQVLWNKDHVLCLDQNAD